MDLSGISAVKTDSPFSCYHQSVENEPLESLRKRIWDYNTLERSLQEEKATVLQSLDRGRHLLQAVACPALEAEVTECTDSWVKLNNDTQSNVKRYIRL